VEGSLALTTDPVIDPGDLVLPESASGAGGVELLTDFPSLGELERRYVARVLTHTKGNMSKAAKILGVDRKTLYRMRESMSHLVTGVESWDVH